MCIRYNRDEVQLERWLAWAKTWVPTEVPVPLEGESFPGSVAPIVVRDASHGRALVSAGWGIVPWWAKDPKFGKKNAYNARSETVAEKPTFREAFRSRRCVVPMSEFFERAEGRWLAFHSASEGVLSVAGVWEEPNKMSPLPTFALVTTEPNNFVAEIHDRMPVILSSEDVDLWMSEDASPEELRTLLTPAPSDWLTVRDAGPISLKPEEPKQDSLF